MDFVGELGIFRLSLTRSRSIAGWREGQLSASDLFLARAATLSAVLDAKPTVSGRRESRQNRLLAALPVGDYQRLLPHLKPVAFLPRSTLHGAGERQQALYFITAGIVSNRRAAEGGASEEFAVTGNEGVIGVASFLGGESMPSQAVALSSGHAYRLEAGVLHREFEHDGPLPRLLLRYMQALITQIGQNAACNRHHLVQQRLCRWILSCIDRLPSDGLAVTQELVADVLGVRRTGITVAAGKLQDAELIRWQRGHITVLDRAGLEERVCECYSVVKHEYERLIPKPDVESWHPAVVTRVREFAYS
jgi:CRP-like cAMP-binding protein